MALVIWGCEEEYSENEPSGVLQSEDAAGDGNDVVVEAPTGWCTDETVLTLDGDTLSSDCAGKALELSPCGGKVTSLVIGSSGVPGQGIDVDGDPATCSPEGSCSDGIDNNLSVLSGLAQEGIDEALQSGTLMLFLEFIGGPDAAAPGAPFTMRMHVAVIDEADEDCDWNTEVCDYRIRPDSYTEDCNAPVVFADATVAEDGSFSAGGDGIELELSIPLFGVPVSLPVKAARLRGTVVYGEDGRVFSMEGLLAGGIPKSDLVDALSEVPEEEFQAGTGLDKATIIDAVDFVMKNDLDLDGDGEFEAASFGALVASRPGVLVGWGE